jgi:hypothetical protein
MVFKVHMVKLVKRRFLSVFLLTVCLSSLRSATLERLSLDDMITKSTAIVRGKITASNASFSGPIIYTHYTIQVSEHFKGDSRSSVDLVVPGGVANNVRQSFPGTPELKSGDEFVFFLWTGRSGQIQIIGLTQGLFALAPGASSSTMATRAASKELMLERGTGQQVKDQTLVMSLSDLRLRISSTLSGGVK